MNISSPIYAWKHENSQSQVQNENLTVEMKVSLKKTISIGNLNFKTKTFYWTTISIEFLRFLYEFNQFYQFTARFNPKRC